MYNWENNARNNLGEENLVKPWWTKTKFGYFDFKVGLILITFD